MADTAVLEREDTETDLSQISPDDQDNTAHYWRIEDLDNIMFGGVSSITALCGYKTSTPPYRAIGGRTRCGKCVELYENDQHMAGI